MTDNLPTEAEVAEWREFLDENPSAPEVSMNAGEFRRLLALVEAWAPIVKALASPSLDPWRDVSPADVKAEWARWKGEA